MEAVTLRQIAKEPSVRVLVGDHAVLISGDEKQVAKAAIGEVSGFGDNLIDGESGAQNRVVSGEPAIAAVIDALVGDVDRREESHRLAEISAGYLNRLLREGFELAWGCGCEEALEARKKGGFLFSSIKRVQLFDK